MTTTTFDGPLPGGSEGAAVRVHPLRCAEVKAPPQYLERSGGRLGPAKAVAGALTTPRSRWPTLPLPAFLVEHPTAGAFMIDTGPSEKMAVGGQRADLGPVHGTLLGGTMKPGQAAGDQVRALGFDPASIPLVVMTHLHYDHLGGSAQFPGAEFLTAGAELDDEPSAGKGTFAHHREAVTRWRRIDGEGAPHAGFARTWDLFGDGAVRLVSTPGHTPGHLSVLLRLAGGRPCLLTVDAAYARRTIDERLVPLLCPDVRAYLRSLDELLAYVAAEPEAIVVCGHDPDRWERDSAEAAAASPGAEVSPAR
jgi:glyoxylase-like metal-dependent hydrolase (beta-lactamase superfamily II)